MFTWVLASPTEPPLVDDAVEPGRRRRWRRWGLVAIAGLFLVFYLGGGWMFSNEIRSGALELDPPGQPVYDVEVLAVEGDLVTLALGGTDNDHVDAPGLRGIEWPEGAGVVANITDITTDAVTREFTLYAGSAPLVKGELLDMHGYVLPADPAALGVNYETVTYASPLGPMAALHFPASGDDWVVLVHGKSAPLRETFRLVTPVVDAEMHALVIEYRNDEGAREDPSGFYRYGATEWEDLAGAVEYAVAAGAEDIALIGYSMGGGIVLSYALESAPADGIDAIMLDAAMVDFGATIDFRAEDRTLPLIGLPVPQSLTNVAKWMAGIRFDIDWGQLDYDDRAEDLLVPILAFHGTADESVPIEPIQQLAEERPDLVELVVVEDAGHVVSWNLDPAAYEASVTAFLTQNLGG